MTVNVKNAYGDKFVVSGTPEDLNFLSLALDYASEYMRLKKRSGLSSSFKELSDCIYSDLKVEGIYE